MTYVPCKTCQHCGTHTSPPYDPGTSSSARNVSCNEPACTTDTRTMRCLVDRCYYSLAYAEASSSEGWLIRDGEESSGARQLSSMEVMLSHRVMLPLLLMVMLLRLRLLLRRGCCC